MLEDSRDAPPLFVTPPRTSVTPMPKGRASARPVDVLFSAGGAEESLTVRSRRALLAVLESVIWVDVAQVQCQVQ